MKSLLTILIYWFSLLVERWASLAVTTLKECVEFVDSYRLPIYNDPFVGTALKPPTF